MIERIISGGQTGADQGGLIAGRKVLIETGGTAPPRFMTEKGPRPTLLRDFGLVEGVPDPKTYRKRTIQNVQDSDGTLWVGRPTSPGGLLTLNTCRRLCRPAVVNPTSSKLCTWLDLHLISVLNVAGNRESSNPGIQECTITLVLDAIAQLRMREIEVY